MKGDSLPIPPKDATRTNTVCQYCTVGCGYEVYTWPVGRTGGARAADNAFGVDLTQPQQALEGLPYTASMCSIVQGEDGRRRHVVVVPAADSPINPQRDHSAA